MHPKRFRRDLRVIFRWFRFRIFFARRGEMRRWRTVNAGEVVSFLIFVVAGKMT